MQPEGASGDDAWLMALYAVDHDFLKTLELKLTAGRNFSTDSSAAYLLNETAAARLGWHGNAVGRTFTWINPKKGPQEGRVIGVVDDFHYQPLRVAIEPVAFSIAPEWYSNLAVRIRPRHVEETLAFLKQTWDELVPAYPFDYAFLDERFGALYEAEQRFGRIFVSRLRRRKAPGGKELRPVPLRTRAPWPLLSGLTAHQPELLVPVLPERSPQVLQHEDREAPGRHLDERVEHHLMP